MNDVDYMPPAVVRFTIPGEPVGKERPRARRVGGFIQLYTPRKTRDYEARVAQLADVAATEQGYEHPTRGWYELEVLVYRTHERKGADVDNTAKIVSDACNNVLWRDDNEVRSVSVRLAGWGASPRVEVTVRAWLYEKTKAKRARKRAA